MAKNKKRTKTQAVDDATSESETMQQSLKNSKDTYKYPRQLLHILGTAQFVYGIYYHWFNVHWPALQEEEELKTRWGGKFKYLTFLNMILQAVYHCTAMLNDFCGTNIVLPRAGKPIPLLRKIRDFIFSALAFPVAHNVCISFWVIYAYDRELIFPVALDAIFPNWLNHIVHTNVAVFALLDLFICFRPYPSRLAGFSGAVVFMLLYIIWLHIVRFFSGQWVYPLLEILSLPFRYVFLVTILAFTVCCYFLGEFLNDIIWASELKMFNCKKKKEQ